MNISLSINNLSHFYGDLQILSDINLEVKEEEIFGLVGLNGVGKNTIIKSILDLITPDNGSIDIFNRSHNITRVRQDIGYLPEKFAPPIHLTGHEFLELSMAFYSLKYNREKAEYLANKLDLRLEALNYSIKKYSKGMGQKLGIISVFLSEAKILILDEPMSGLDPKARIALKNELNQYHQQKSATIFFSSHIMADVEEICHKIALLDRGSITYVGSIEQFIKKYRAKDLERALLQAIENAKS